MSNSFKTITGCSGQLGQKVVDHLLEQPHHALRATTRKPEKLLHLRDIGIDVRLADFDQPATLKTAFEGTQRLLLISTDQTNIGKKRISQHRNAIAAAEMAGVKHTIYTSLLKADNSPLGVVAEDHAETESILKDSRMGFSILRNAFYMEMLLLILPSAIASGELVSGAGDGRIAYISRNDCAHAAACALLANDTDHHCLNMTGRQALGFEDIVAITNKTFGTNIIFKPLSQPALIQHMTNRGVSREFAGVLAHIDNAISQDAMNLVSDDFQGLTGRQPIGVDTFLLEHYDVIMEDAKKLLR